MRAKKREARCEGKEFSMRSSQKRPTRGEVRKKRLKGMGGDRWRRHATENCTQLESLAKIRNLQLIDML